MYDSVWWRKLHPFTTSQEFFVSASLIVISQTLRALVLTLKDAINLFQLFVEKRRFFNQTKQ